MNIWIAYYLNDTRVTMLSAYDTEAAAKNACQLAAHEWGIGQLFWSRDWETGTKISSTKHVSFHVAPRILNGVSE